MLTFFGVGKGDKEKFPQFEQALEVFLNEVSNEEGTLEFKVF